MDFPHQHDRELTRKGRHTRYRAGMTSLTPPALQALREQLQTVILGKAEVIDHAITALLAGGHILLEDLPGVGKTTLAHALAHSLGLAFARVQFTSDMLPGDLLGSSVFHRDRGEFQFMPGPVFHPILLADEINRASPRTQSALLEAMEERQVSVDGVTRPLPEPFFVMATQNPLEQAGTHALPESQLDRFAVCLSMGYPDRAAERALLAGEDRRAMLRRLFPVMDAGTWAHCQALVGQVTVSDALLDELLALVEATRDGRWFKVGLSPRGAQTWLKLARARALLQGRTYVVPDDLRDLAGPVLRHRLQPVGQSSPSAQIQAMLAAVPWA